jgi:hypothetical protein
VKVVRGPRRVNALLAAVREFLKCAVGTDEETTRSCGPAARLGTG